jgi:hypothetical protein
VVGKTSQRVDRTAATPTAVVNGTWVKLAAKFPSSERACKGTKTLLQTAAQSSALATTWSGPSQR